MNKKPGGKTYLEKEVAKRRSIRSAIGVGATGVQTTSSGTGYGGKLASTSTINLTADEVPWMRTSGQLGRKRSCSRRQMALRGGFVRPRTPTRLATNQAAHPLCRSTACLE